MKDFIDVSFDVSRCKQELDELRGLLEAHEGLLEQKQVKPFFEMSRQLLSLLGYYAGIGPATQLSYEFDIGGDFRADIVVGDQKTRTYCMVEFEEGGLESIFIRQKPRNTKGWNRRFEHGFSQLVDWFYALDDLKNTGKFSGKFGNGHTTFHGLLVIGRSQGLSSGDIGRLQWRSDRVLINSHKIKCVTYDALYGDLIAWLKYLAPTAPG